MAAGVACGGAAVGDADGCMEAVAEEVLWSRPGLSELCVGGAVPAGSGGEGFVSGADGGVAVSVGVLCRADGLAAPLGGGLAPVVDFYGRATHVLAAPDGVWVTAAAGEVDEGDDAVFSVRVRAAPQEDLVVALSVVDSPVGDFVDPGAAPCVQGADPADPAPAGCGVVVTILAGDTEAELAVPTLDDGVVEPDGSVTVRVEPGVDYSVGSPSSAAVVVADDDVPEVTLSAGPDPDVEEGAAAVFSLSVDQAPLEDLVVALSVSEIGDFVASGGLGARAVTVAKGDTEVRFSVATVDDGVDEADGSVTATVEPGGGYVVGSPSSAVVKVADDDVPTVTVTAGSGVEEGAAAVFTLSVEQAALADLDVNLTVSESGGFVTSGELGDRTATIAKGATSVVVSVATVDDGVDKAHGSVTVAVAAGSGYTAGSSATVAVADDEVPEVAVAAKAAAVAEGDPAVFVFSVSPVPGADLVVAPVLSVVGKVLDSGSPPPESVTLAAGASEAEFSVETEDDGDVEDSGKVTVTVDDAAVRYADAGFGGEAVAGDPASATVEVADDDNVTVTVTAVGAAVAEGVAAVFTVAANEKVLSDLEVSVSVAQSGLFVAAGELGTRSLTIAKDTSSVQLKVPTVDDELDEADGSVTVTVLDDPVKSRPLLGLWEPDYSVGNPSSDVVAVADDDAAAVTITAGPDVVEGQDAVFTLTAAQEPTGDLKVKLRVSQTGAVVRSGHLRERTVTIAKGTTEAQIRVPTRQDGSAGTDATVTAELVPGSVTGGGAHGGGFQVGRPRTATVGVGDNGLAVTIDAAADTVVAGAPAVFALTATKAPSEDLEVTLSVTGSGGVADPDDLGERTVTVAKGTTGARLAVATVAGGQPVTGAVSATIGAVGGDTFAIGSPRTATVRVTDGATVTITAPRGNIYQREDAVFTLTTDTAVPADLRVTVDVTTSGRSVLRQSRQKGTHVYTIPKGQTTLTIRIGTRNTRGDGAITVTVMPRSHYTVGSPNSATVNAELVIVESPLNCWQLEPYKALRLVSEVVGWVKCKHSISAPWPGDVEYELETLTEPVGGNPHWRSRNPKSSGMAVHGPSCDTPGVDYAIRSSDYHPPLEGDYREEALGETLLLFTFDVCNDGLDERYEIAELRLNLLVNGLWRHTVTGFAVRDW